MLTRPTILCMSFLLATAGTVVLTTSCAQPVINCTSAHGYFAAEYVMTSGDANSACGLPGDLLGIDTYYQEGGANGTPDYQNALLVIRAASIGDMIDYAEARGAIDESAIDDVYHSGNAAGFFDGGFPNDDGFCAVEAFDEDAHVVLPAIEEIPDDPMTPDDDESQPAQDAVDITYSWSNLRFVVTADAQGTQFEGDLEYSDGTAGCTASFHVVGLYPVVGCETDEECNDDANGINPSFAVRCNTDIGMCVPSKDLPSYE